MLRSISFDVTAAAGAEGLTNFFTTPAGEKRTVKRVVMESGSDTELMMYVDQDRVIHEATEIANYGYQPFEYDVPIAEGFACRAGFLNKTAGALTKKVTVWYLQEK